MINDICITDKQQWLILTDETARNPVGFMRDNLKVLMVLVDNILKIK